MFTDLSSNLFRRVLGTLSLTILSHLFEIWDRRMTIKSCQGCGPSFDGTSYFNTWGFSNSSVDTGLHPFQSSSKWWSCQKSRQKLWAKLLMLTEMVPGGQRGEAHVCGQKGVPTCLGRKCSQSYSMEKWALLCVKTPCTAQWAEDSGWWNVIRCIWTCESELLNCPLPADSEVRKVTGSFTWTLLNLTKSPWESFWKNKALITISCFFLKALF